MKKTRWIPALAVLASTAGGCAELELTGPEGMAKAEVYFRDESSGTTAARADEAASPGEETSSSTASPEALASDGSGSLEVTARVFVQAEGGGWVELTNGAVTRTVAASESSATLFAESAIELSSYSRVRIEFERVRGSLATSAVVGLGSAQGDVTVELGSDGRAVVEREIRFTARSDATTRLVIDLNSEAWAASRTQSSAVAEGTFAGAVEILAEES